MRHLPRFVVLVLACLVLGAGAANAQDRRPPDTPRAAPRPNYSAPLGAPYTAEDVTVPTPSFSSRT